MGSGQVRLLLASLIETPLTLDSMEVRTDVDDLPPAALDPRLGNTLGRAPILVRPSSKVAFLIVIAACVFFLPYLVPVAPSVSMSYLTGFSNRTAALLFACGCVLFALLTRGEIAAFTDKNTSLGRSHLYAALAIAALGCSLSLYPVSTLPHGTEAAYNINRLQMLLAGGRPYRDFEFAYGAAHLYAPWLFAKTLRLSTFAAYYTWWVLEWFVGTAMAWYSIRQLEIAPHQPCREIYRTPDIWPPLRNTAAQNCLETGYFIGPVNVFTTDAIQRKIAELDQRPRKPILLFDMPMSAQMPPLETDPAGLHWQGEALYYPKIRRQPITYAPIFDYIAQNYTPDPNPIPQPDGWNYRVWRPKAQN